MASETSAVLVAVRVRPFFPREDPITCSITVPDSTTISIVDVAAVVSEHVGGTSGAGDRPGKVTISGDAPSAALGNASARHSYTFDKIFWSVPSNVLPMSSSDVFGALTTGRRGGTAGGGDSNDATGGTADGGIGMSSLGALLQSGRQGSFISNASFSVALGGASVGPSSIDELASSVRQGQRAVLGAAGGANSTRSSPRTGHLNASSTTGSALPLAVVSGLAPHLPCVAPTPASDDQASVYAFIGPRLYQAALSGFNACLFAYGQTGSGKTYSMIGPTERLSHKLSEDAGIMPRLCADLFAHMRQVREKDETVSFSVEVSFFEIYCEKVRDLLASPSAATGTAPSSSAGSGAAGAASGQQNSSSSSSAAAAFASIGTSGSAGGALLGGGNTNTSAFYSASNTVGGLRVRQHPSRGPYVEGLSRLKVRDAEGIMRHLLHGLRDRATAETKMNEHSSRSHAILQLHITRVAMESGDTGAVVTKTRECKLNMVDLAGSERVTQSGVTGERFEEARNINLSLSTLGRVIHQLSEKQSGRSVIPSYRDSVLTWLLSDSLGGNSKTIMLATVAASGYCYQQSLNTLRFAGVAKKVINVATVNEDQQFQQLITELRQQIVRLTVQVEKGKASEVHMTELATLRREKEELQQENLALRAKATMLADPALLQTLRKRVAELEEANSTLQEEKRSVLQRLLSSSTALREEIAKKREELLQLHEKLAKRESEVQEWARRYHDLQREKEAATLSQPATYAVARAKCKTASAKTDAATLGEEPNSASPPPSTPSLTPQNSTEGPPLKELADRVAAMTKERDAHRAAAGAAHKEVAALQKQLSDVKSAEDAVRRQVTQLQERLERTRATLEVTQCELATYKTSSSVSAESPGAEKEPHTIAGPQRTAVSQTAAAGTASGQPSPCNAPLLSADHHHQQQQQQLEETRRGYLAEKQSNVTLLRRVAELEQAQSSVGVQHHTELAELELLLLEETETSERYYLRLRCERSVAALKESFWHHVAALHASRVPGNTAHPVARGDRDVAGSVVSTLFSPLLLLSPSESASPRPMSLAASMTDAYFSATAASVTPLELLYAQIEYEYLSAEAHRRTEVEVEYLEDWWRLYAQHARVQQNALAALREECDAWKEHVAVLEENLRDAKAARAVTVPNSGPSTEELPPEDATAFATRSAAAAAAAVLSSEEAAALGRRLRDAEAQCEDLSDTNAVLVQKLAALENECAALRERCALAEAAAEDAEGEMQALRERRLTLPGVDDNDDLHDSSLPEGGVLSTNGEATATASLPTSRRGSLLCGDRNEVQQQQALLLQLAARDEERQRLLAQCEEYREEVGLLQAQLANETTTHAAQRTLAEQEDELRRSEVEALQTAKAQLTEAMEAAQRDYERRVRQQQEMLATMREALEEETAMADACREKAQRAESARVTCEEALASAQDTCEALRRQHVQLEGRCHAAESALEALREQFSKLEQQLLDLRQREPELYLLLERGDGEDSAAWLSKAQQEKANLQKQTQETRRLNAELLEHVRRRNSRLRHVQEELTGLPAMAGSGHSGDADGTVIASPLRASNGLDDMASSLSVTALPARVAP